MEHLVMKVEVWRLEADKSKQGFDCLVKRDFLGSFDVELSHSKDTGQKKKKLDKDEENRFFYFDPEEEHGDILRPS